MNLCVENIVFQLFCLFLESDHEIKLQEVRSQSPSLVEEQRQLKESLKKALQDDSDEESGLLKKKEKTKEEKVHIGFACI